MKYTVKKRYYVKKAMKAMTPDEVVNKLRHLDFGGGAGFRWIEMDLLKIRKTKIWYVTMNLNQGRSRIDLWNLFSFAD
jgi:hypothetical protein